jgi:hypothetical protein
MPLPALVIPAEAGIQQKDAATRRIQNWMPASAHYCLGKYGINAAPCTRHSRAGGNLAKDAAKRPIRNWMPACAGMTTVRLHRFLLLSWQCRHASRSVEKSRPKALLLQSFPGQLCASAGMTMVRLCRFLLLSWQCPHTSRSVEKSSPKVLLLQYFPGQQWA